MWLRYKIREREREDESHLRVKVIEIVKAILLFSDSIQGGEGGLRLLVATSIE